LWFTKEVTGSVAKVFALPTHHQGDECPGQTVGSVAGVPID